MKLWYQISSSRIGTIFHSLFYLIGVPIYDGTYDGSSDYYTSDIQYALVDPWNSSSVQKEVEKCYQEFGCFRPKFPELRGFYLLPDSFEDINPSICFYHGSNSCSERCEIVETDTVANLSPAPDPEGTSYWITHGYMENGNRPWVKEMACELLKTSNHTNVFILDWAEGSKPPYNQAVVNIELVAAYAAKSIKNLNKHYNLPISKIHIIGHSLGSQLAGSIGSLVTENMNTSVGRITGLDPAQPHFEGYPASARLSIEDATFVDVIHTDGRPFMEGGVLGVGLGIQESTGHADFYANNGKDQPGCRDGVYNAILQEDGSFLYGIRRFLGCDHMRSYEYFIESIKQSSCHFVSFSCESWEKFLNTECSYNQSRNKMGFHAEKPEDETAQVYYLVTGSKPPFCRDHFVVTFNLLEEPSYMSTSDVHLILNTKEKRETTLMFDWTDLRSGNGNGNGNGNGHGNGNALPSIRLLREGNYPYPGPISKVTLRPAMSNPLLWFVNKMAPKTPDLIVESIFILHLESGITTKFCPENNANSFSISDQSPKIVLFPC